MQAYHEGSTGPDDHDDDSSPPKDDKVKAESRKGIINRVNRACTRCRKLKMRCELKNGGADPPCKRCRNGGLECIMEKPGRPAGEGFGEDRIRSLESQVTSIQNTLTDLVQTLRTGMGASSGASNGSGQTPPVQKLTPDHGGGLGTGSGSSHRSPFQHQPPFHPLTALAAQPRLSQSAASPSSLGQSVMASRPSPGSITYNPYATSAVFETSTRRGSEAPSPYPMGGDFRMPLPPQSAGSSSGQSWQVFATPGANPTNQHLSLPPSRSGSETPDDFLTAEGITAPLGAMSNMAGLVEAAVERAREERSSQSPANLLKRASFGDDDGSMDDRGAKKAKLGSNAPAVVEGQGPAVVEAQGLPQTLAPPKPKSKVKKTHVHAYPDCVGAGFVTEEEGRELLGIYYAGSSNFIPCYDPTFDTWESLKVRSPFSITVMVMVGARVRDGGGPMGDIHRACREHAQMIAKGTMFNPVARIEAVQAMSILAAFSDNGWLPGGHAVRMALDMGINKSFIKLLRSGMGKGKTPEELEEERPLVVHSRVWFCLYLMEHQMAYGMGRPAILREDETIHQCRRLLEHPLSITSDARLISTVELTALRAPLHVELTATPDLPIDQHTLKRLKQANHEFDSWERYWDRVLSDRFGKGKGDFFRESLAIQRQYAELFVNSQLLRGIQEPSDIVSMPEEKRALALRAMKNAQHCLEICLKGENYRNGLRYAVHYTHVCAAFAASFLIRIARLFPQELNLKKTAKDVEELARVLSEVPAGRYARSLRLILRRARRAKVIPTTSGNTSPNRTHAMLSMTAMNPTTSGITPSPALAAFSPTTGLPTTQPAAGMSSVSPSNLIFNATSQIFEDSPSSAQEISEFDFLFAQENLERSGLQLGEGDPLPLFLDGHSLGNALASTDTAPFVGLEHFFLPADVDNRLAGQGGSLDVLGTDVWW